jgi:membrane-associated phospholipid phosphatase
LRSSDWVAFLYFLYLAAVCWLRPVSTPRRLLVTSVSLATAALVVSSRAATPLVHDWLPMVYIGVGYYLTGRLFVKPSERLESWLLEWDRRLLRDPTTRFARWPAPLVAYLDIVYTFTFLLLPAGFALLAANGRSALADHYWTLVLAADLGAFAPLSVFQTRPPWILERAPDLPARSVHRLASFMVRHATIRVNTFPSGHVAVSLAVALGVVGAMPVAGAVLFVLAASIAVACVVGRYHYAMDVVAGVVLAAVVWTAARVVGI